MGKTLRRKSRNFRKSRKRPIRHKKHKKHSKRRSTHRVNRKMKGGVGGFQPLYVGDGLVFLENSDQLGRGWGTVGAINSESHQFIGHDTTDLLGKTNFKMYSNFPTFLLKEKDSRDPKWDPKDKSYFLAIPFNENDQTVSVNELKNHFSSEDRLTSLLTQVKTYVDIFNAKADAHARGITIPTKLSFRKGGIYLNPNDNTKCLEIPSGFSPTKSNNVVVVQLGYHKKTEDDMKNIESIPPETIKNLGDEDIAYKLNIDK